MAKKKDTIRYSYSATDTFMQCPEKYWKGKTHKMRLQASAFAFGSAFEAGVDLLMEGKTLTEAFRRFKDEWTVRPANDWEEEKEVFDSPDMFYYQSDFDPKLLTHWDERLCDEWAKDIVGKSAGPAVDITKTAMELMKDNKPIDENVRQLAHRVLWMCCRRRGFYMLQAFERDILPTVKKVIAMQKKTEVSNEEDDVVSGRIDYIVELKNISGTSIMDLKSAGKFYDQHKLDTSYQLGIYSFAEDIDNVGYWVVLKKMNYKTYCDTCGRERENNRKKNCEDDKNCKGKYTVNKPYADTQTLTKKMDEFTTDTIMEDYSEIGTAIKNKVRWKNPNSCFNYGTRCEFYESCWKGKPLDELEHLEKRAGKRK